MSTYKAKIESVETTDRGGKSVKFSGGWTGNALFTGKDKDKNVVPFPTEAVVGAEIEINIEVVNTRTGGTWNALSFPSHTPAPQAQEPQVYSGASSWKGNRQEDVELKLTSFGYSYAKDLFAATPEASMDGLVKAANILVDAMRDTYVRIRG